MFSVICEVNNIVTYNCRGTVSCRNRTWVCQVGDRFGLLPSVSSFPAHTLRCGWPRCSWPLSAEQSTDKCCAGKIPINTQKFSHLRVNIVVLWNVHFRLTMKSINSFNKAAWSTGVDKHLTEVQEEAKIRIQKHSCKRHYTKFWKASFSLWPLSSLPLVKKKSRQIWLTWVWVGLKVGLEAVEESSSYRESNPDRPPILHTNWGSSSVIRKTNTWKSLSSQADSRLAGEGIHLV